VLVVESGTVLRFDGVRGYGFIAPESGGEDVFVHANDVGELKNQLRSGTKVEFDTEEGDRGLKVASLRIVSTPGPSASFSNSYPGGGAATFSGSGSGDDDEVCDVLSPRDLAAEVTEALLRGAPTLTGAQIVQVRQELNRLATRHGWVEA
jgi:cold shock CspA family protein